MPRIQFLVLMYVYLIQSPRILSSRGLLLQKVEQVSELQNNWDKVQFQLGFGLCCGSSINPHS